MKIVLIGSGNVASHLARAFSKVVSMELQIWSRNATSAQGLAQEVGAKSVEFLKDINTTADYVVIAVKDDAISAIVEQLSSTFKSDFKPLLIHTSGAIPMDVFKGKVDDFGVLYPLQTFSKFKALDFEEVPLFLEASSEANLKSLETLTALLVKKYWPLNSEKRKVLHLSAVFACNFTNHLYALSKELLDQSDLSFDMLKPLILETADKIKDKLPDEVQTGPAVRNDEVTLKMHEDMLADNRDMLFIYQILSRSIKNTNN